jgi:hypothetical protein
VLCSDRCSLIGHLQDELHHGLLFERGPGLWLRSAACTVVEGEPRDSAVICNGTMLLGYAGVRALRQDLTSFVHAGHVVVSRVLLYMHCTEGSRKGQSRETRELRAQALSTCRKRWNL